VTEYMYSGHCLLFNRQKAERRTDCHQGILETSDPAFSFCQFTNFCFLFPVGFFR
jgi:hypothetical protein